MKKLLTKILFRLLERSETYDNIDEDLIENWLATHHGDKGFREYFRKRNLQLLKAIGMGVEKEKYWLLVGQRYEMIRMAEQMKKSFKKQDKGR